MKNKKYVYYVNFHCFYEVFINEMYEIGIFIISVQSVVREIDRMSRIGPASYREIPNSNLGPKTEHTDSNYRGYPQFRHENASLVPQIKQWPHHFLFIIH
jgi:hypothetical protein